ncbi:endonuclease/exonuclease/phosphatase family protein [Porphyromonas loveana]|nr:endonuclease/exonuclease/phosphatase family protein [Porphyromonas loveana]
MMKALIPTLGIAAVAGSMAPAAKPVSFRVMTYNVENLFDTYDDKEKDDNDFLPDGKMEWTEGRYNRKLRQIASVISEVGQDNWPALVALAEIENDTVMTNLIRRTHLGRQGYQYVMTNSPDNRGIDVALLYLPEQFQLVHKEEFRIHFRESKDKRSRNILHARGRLANGDLLDVFVGHFPSRRGGVGESDPDRHDAAQLLRDKSDEILKSRKNAYILIMGDLNSNPSEAPLIQTLRAQNSLPKDGNASMSQLYNLTGNPVRQTPPGTTIYKGKWKQLDHIIVSGSFLRSESRVRYRDGSVKNVVLPRLVREAPYNVSRIVPNRTYQGVYYRGGHSDHLPVVADFIVDL